MFKFYSFTRFSLNLIITTFKIYRIQFKSNFLNVLKPCFDEKYVYLIIFLADSSLNIRAEERVALRMVRQDLSLLHRFILNMINENANNQSFTNSDKQLLLETIHRNCDALAQFLHWIDQKTERRWWLKDLINFLQVVLFNLR
jgi:hypothetical protein